MTIQDLNELFDIRRKEIQEQKFSYNFYNNICKVWNKLIIFLEENNLNYNNNSKTLFLEKMKEIVKTKDYSYYCYALTIIDGLDKLNIC